MPCWQPLSQQTPTSPSATSVPDPHRWLEDHTATDAVAWWTARAAEADDWIGTDDLTQLSALLTERRLARPLPPRLWDHQSGKSLWALPARIPDARASVSSRFFVQVDGQPFPGTPLLLDEETAAAPLCAAKLSPSGDRVLLGHIRTEGDTPACVLTVGPTKSTAPRREVGRWSWAQASWMPDGDAIAVAHPIKRRNALSTIALDDLSRTTQRRTRWFLHPRPLPNGELLAIGSWHPHYGLRRAMVMLGAPGAVDWLGDGIWRAEYALARVVGWTGEQVLLFTDRLGPETVVQVDPEAPFQEDWRVLVEQRPGMALADAQLHGDDLLLVWSRDGQDRLEIRDHDGPEREYADLGFAAGVIRFVTDGIIEARSVSELRWLRREADGSLTLLHREALASGVRVQTAVVPSSDGVEVPITLVTPDGPAPPGGWPIRLWAYGGFGHSQALSALNEPARLWLAAGGAVGVVHARGGQERGEAWHTTAQLGGLQRTYDDVIAAARGLVAAGIAAPGRVALEGTSNGGLTVAAALAQAPDAFGAGIANAGVHDLLRGPKFGRWWPGEYGAASDPAQAAVLRSISPAHAVPAGPLPPLLLTTGQADPIVSPAHSYKLAAAWRDAPGGPVLLTVDPLGSHGADPAVESVTDADRDQLAARKLLFLSRALGVPLLGEE